MIWAGIFLEEKALLLFSPNVSTHWSVSMCLLVSCKYSLLSTTGWTLDTVLQKACSENYPFQGIKRKCLRWLHQMVYTQGIASKPQINEVHNTVPLQHSFWSKAVFNISKNERATSAWKCISGYHWLGSVSNGGIQTMMTTVDLMCPPKYKSLLLQSLLSGNSVSFWKPVFKIFVGFQASVAIMLSH